MPKKGLNVPVMTVVDIDGNIIEADQRNLIRYTIQGGRGVSSLFICGTTGEFNRLTNEQRRQLITIGVDEINAENEKLDTEQKVGSWVGVTSETKAETLENLRLAIDLKADMAVIAPMAIGDLDPQDAVRFFLDDVRGVLNDHGFIEIGLYENADIALHGTNGGLLTFDQIREIIDMPFIACAKASADQATLTQYIREFSIDGRLDLQFYFGNAPMIFEMKQIQNDAGIDKMPVVVSGVVSGTANVFPAEWRQAWQLVLEGRDDLNEPFKKAFDSLVGVTSFAGYGGNESKLLAGLKYALYRLGIISSPAVAHGTPVLSDEERMIVDNGLGAAVAILRENVDPKYLSDATSKRLLKTA